MRAEALMSIDEKKLRADFESYLRGDEPPVVALATAPLLYQWEARTGRGADGQWRLTLHGSIEGDHMLPSGAEVGTATVVWIDRDLKWARSRDRLYRLGDRVIPIDGVDL